MLDASEFVIGTYAFGGDLYGMYILVIHKAWLFGPSCSDTAHSFELVLCGGSFLLNGEHGNALMVLVRSVSFDVGLFSWLLLNYDVRFGVLFG